MVEVCICLDCGGIRWREYGSYDKYFLSSESGIIEENTDFELDSSRCNECDSGRINFFNLDVLSVQERVLFFHYDRFRRLLMFLRLSKVTSGLVRYPVEDNYLEEKIGQIERELNL